MYGETSCTLYCLVAFQTKPPKVIVRDDQDDSRSKDEGLGDTTESRTDDLSKSDTHEEVSEIALDNTSTHRYVIHPQRNSAVNISQSSLDNDRAMIRWICNVKANDEVSSDSLLSKLGLQDIDVVLRSSRMRWYGHVERSKGWIAQVRKLNIVAQKRSGKPRKSWDEVLLDDRKKLGMDTADPQNRSEWRGRLRRRLVKQVQPSVEDNEL